MNNIKILALSSFLISNLVLAHTIQNGAPLPTVSVQEEGEILLNGENVSYSNWQSSDLTGKVRVIQAIAGRSAAKEMNAPLVEAIKAANLPKEKYQTTTIINQDDAIWGTGSFVKSSAEDSKRAFSWSSIVLDANGEVAQTWRLKDESSMIAVVDQQGIVQFVREGALSSQEVEQVMALIDRLIK